MLLPFLVHFALGGLVASPVVDPPGTVKVISSAAPLMDQATGEAFVMMSPEEVLTVYVVGPAKLQCAFRVNVGKKAKVAPAVTLEVMTNAKDPVKLKIVPRLNKTAWRRPVQVRPSESAEFYVQIPEGPQTFEFRVIGATKQGGALRVVDSFSSQRSLEEDAPVLNLQGSPVSMPGVTEAVVAPPMKASEPDVAAPPSSPDKTEPVAAPSPAPSERVAEVKMPVMAESPSADSVPPKKFVQLRGLLGGGMLGESSQGLGSTGMFEAQLGAQLAFTDQWSLYGGWELRAGEVAVPFVGDSQAARQQELRHAIVLDVGLDLPFVQSANYAVGLAATLGYRLHASSNQAASGLAGFVGAQAGVFVRTQRATLKALGGGGIAAHDSASAQLALGKNVARFSATLEAQVDVVGPLALLVTYRGEFLLRQFALRQAHTMLLGAVVAF